MSKSSEKNNCDIFKEIENALLKLNIKSKQNDIELIFAHFNFDFNKTIETFENQSANDILQEWRTSRRKKHIRGQTKTSTPRKSLNIIEESKIDLNRTTRSKNPREENRVCPIVYNNVLDEIKKYEASIQEYEKKMENCSNSDLLKYYINRCNKLSE